MRIGMIGLGKLGLPVALAIDSRGHDVYGYDVNPDVNTYLSTKSLPYREEGIGPYLENNGIVVCGSIHSVVTNSEIVFLAIQTPHKPEYDGDDVLPADREDFNYQYLKEALTDIAKACYDLKKQTIVAVISTCLPGTFERELKPLLNDYVQYVYAPQFIAMGTVIDDYLNPEFNLIGVHHPEAAEVIEEFYLSINDAPPVKTDITTAEGIKLSYNAWITTKTVIANAWGEMSDKLGMNFDDIKLAWDMSTKRIVSSKYMNAGMSDGGGCFPPGELVMTRTGMRPIEAIDPGDEVLTAEGLFQPVVKRWERHYEGDLVSVQVRGLPPVRMTVDHPVLVRGDGRKRVPGGRRNTLHRIVDKLISAEEVCAAELTVDSLIGWPHVKDGSYPLRDPRYVELAGWWLSEGGAELSDRRGRLCFSLHEREEADALRIEELLLACAEKRTSGRGASAKIAHWTEGNRRSVRFGNKGLATKLVNDFGKGAANKYIPEDLLWGDLEQAKLLLRGLIRGDGHRSPQGVSFSTVSEQLAWGVFAILHRLGLNPTLRDILPRVGHSGQAHQRAFEVRVRNRRLASELCEIVGWERYDYGKEIHTYADDGLMVWRHVQKLDRERYSGPVYNLWVDEIHSYVVGCGAVSNCHPRDNIAMSWLANEIGMSHNIWDSLMQARQYYEGWHAEVAAETADETGLPLVLLGTAFKPETDIKAGSAAMLMANILRRRGVPFLHVDDLDPITIPAVYFIATQHARYAEYDWPQGSVVIDPFGYLEDRDGVEVIRLGREPR